MKTRQEYYQENKEIIKEKNKIYKEENKEIIKEKNKIYRSLNKFKLYICECGSELTIHHKARHLESKKHQNFIK